MAAQEQHQQQANRGILPSETLNALDYLVDRLNASSGRLPSSVAATSSPPPSNDGKGGVPPAATDTDDAGAPLPIRALLVGTNEGVGLSRSLGTAHAAAQLRRRPDDDPNSASFSHSGSMSEEVLSGVETVWATLASAVPPHVMAASAAGGAAAAAATGGGGNGAGGGDDDEFPPHVQPPHPLLSPLRMGDRVKTVTAVYDNCAVMHVHVAPLVVTFVTLPDANLGAIRDAALPPLGVLLEPVRRALVRSRGGGAGVGGDGGGMGPPGAIGRPGPGVEMTMEQHARAQQQAAAMSFLPQHHPQHPSLPPGAYGEGEAMDAMLRQQMYEQQLFEQQQAMLAQQQQFRR